MFITLEGIEGAGKTSQVAPIVDFFRANGRRCAVTREPGGTRVGEKIRAILLDPDNRDLDPVAELLLYMADRAQHLRTVVKPHLAAGRIVLCDRYFDATLAYQGYARGLDRDLIRQLHRRALDDFKPDLTLLLDLPPEKGLARAWRQINAGGRTDRETRFEKERLAFHRKVRAGYLDLAAAEPRRFRIIDADRPEEQVRTAIRQALMQAIDNGNKSQ